MASTVRYFVVHHSATKRGNSQLLAINRYHKEEWNMKSKLGWYVGYHGLIDSDGTFTQTRLLGEETVAVKGHNADVPKRFTAVHICIVFDGMTELPSEAQLQTLRDVHRGHIKLQGEPVVIKDLEVKFHRDLQKERLCPGNLVTYELMDKWLYNLRDPFQGEREKYQNEIKRLTGQLDFLRSELRKLLQ